MTEHTFYNLDQKIVIYIDCLFLIILNLKTKLNFYEPKKSWCIRTNSNRTGKSIFLKVRNLNSSCKRILSINYKN